MDDEVTPLLDQGHQFWEPIYGREHIVEISLAGTSGVEIAAHGSGAKIGGKHLNSGNFILSQVVNVACKCSL
jgi:hypothetical protein